MKKVLLITANPALFKQTKDLIERNFFGVSVYPTQVRNESGEDSLLFFIKNIKAVNHTALMESFESVDLFIVGIPNSGSLPFFKYLAFLKDEFLLHEDNFIVLSSKRPSDFMLSYGDEYNSLSTSVPVDFSTQFAREDDGYKLVSLIKQKIC